MANFHRLHETSLYLAAQQPADQGFCAYLLPAGATADAATISYEDALDKAGGHFLLGAAAPDLDSAEQIDGFITRVRARIDDRLMPGVQAIVWLADRNAAAPDNLPLIGFQTLQTQRQITYGLVAELLPGLKLRIDTRCLLTLAGTDLQLSPHQGGRVALTGSHAIDVDPGAARIPLDGARRGCVTLDGNLDIDALVARWQWGMRFAYPPSAETTAAECESLFFAFAHPGGTAGALQARVSVDIADPAGATVAVPTGDTVRSGVMLAHDQQFVSGWVSAQGNPILLRTVSRLGEQPPFLAQWQSAGMVMQRYRLSDGGDAAFGLAPIGDFKLEVDDGSVGARRLMCGLSAGETLGFMPYPGDDWQSDVLRFVANRPAYAAGFPFAPQSPLQPPPDLSQPLLNDSEVTSWATLRGYRNEGPEAENRYLTQAEGAALYGHDQIVHPVAAEFLGAVTPSVPLPRKDEFAVPLIPHFGTAADDPQAAAEFEIGIATAERRKLIAASRAFSTLLDVAGDPATPVRATTPTGLVAAIAADGHWTELTLARSPDDAGDYLRFTNLDPVLQQAFQAGEPFAVIANAAHTGAAAENEIGIDGWRMRVAPGQGNVYGSYRNVLIVKFRRGRLRDLVADTRQWVNALELALPEPAATPDELVVLSQWLQEYIDAATTSDDVSYAEFRRIATDERWTGVLALNIDITATPPALAGLTAGLDTATFRAHHLGITVNQVDAATLELAEGNALFGLIDYRDPAFDPASGAETIPALGSEPYEFRVLRLQVLFANSQVKDFASHAQLSLMKLFGARVNGVNEPDNLRFAIPFYGGFQRQQDTVLYSLDAQGTYQFFTDSTVLPRMMVRKAEFRTESNDAVFSLWGFLDFQQVEGFDLLSFGNLAGQSKVEAGLAFNGLLLRFPAEAGQSPHFETAAMAFDGGDSRCRPHSLFEEFPLRVEGLILGDAAQTPTDLGFVDVHTPDLTGGLRGRQWTGLVLGLNLGTPGDLATAAGFRASLLIAWSPTASAADEALPVQVGLRLPGTAGGGGLSLQGALQLSIGNVELTTVPFEERRVFLLKLEDVALSFLGLTRLPPGGSTSFYLFADPAAQATTGGLGWYAAYNRNPKAGSEVSGP